MMKRTPGLMLMVLGIVALHRFAPIPAQPAGPAMIQALHGLAHGMPADESGDDDGDDDGDSGESE